MTIQELRDKWKKDIINQQIYLYPNKAPQHMKIEASYKIEAIANCMQDFDKVDLLNRLWYPFTEKTPINNKYINVKFYDGRIKSYRWAYDFYTGDADRNIGSKWKYVE